MRFPLLCAVFLTLGPVVRLLGAEPLATGPKGGLRIEPDAAIDNKEWVVSVAKPSERAQLGETRDAQPGTFWFSPDEKWIAATYHLGSRMGTAELYRQTSGVKFGPAQPGARMGQRLWQYFDRANGQKGERNAAAQSEERGIVDFIAWSPDSSRALFAVREGDRGGDGTYHWGAYYDTRTGEWAQTDYLRAYNRTAANRWRNGNRNDPAGLLCCAESVAPLPAKGALQARLDAADHELNKSYQALQKALNEEERTQLRSSQRQWIAARDRGAAMFARFGNEAEAAARRLQYLGEATSQQAKSLHAWLDSKQ